MMESSRGFPIVGPRNHFRRGLLKASGPEILFGTKFLVNLHPKEGYSIVAETLSFAEAFIGSDCIMAPYVCSHSKIGSCSKVYTYKTSF